MQILSSRDIFKETSIDFFECFAYDASVLKNKKGFCKIVR